MRAQPGRWLAAGVAAALASCFPAAAAQRVEPPAFTQARGVSGCVMQFDHPVDHGCLRAGGLALPRSVALSPDDRFAYVVSGGTLRGGSNGVVAFRRDVRTGALSRVGCVSADGGDGRAGSEGACARGDALVGASDVAIAPDGRAAYVASSRPGGVAWLARDVETGALTPAGCVEHAPRGDRCARLRHLAGVTAVAVSPDGRDVYVASPATGSVHALRRDATGALTRTQCLAQTGLDGACDATAGLRGVRDVTVSPDGRAVYAAGASGAVTAFARDPATGRLTPTACLLAGAPDVGPCDDAGGIRRAAAVAVSPDGRDVYVAAPGSDAVASFRVAPDGGLRQTGCLQRVPRGRAGAQPPDKRCVRGTALWEPSDVVVSADGRTVFAGGLDTVTSFRRDPDTGVLTQLGCAEEVRSTKACARVRATFGINALATTADGRHLYATATAENAVAVLRAAVDGASGDARAGRAEPERRLRTVTRRGFAGAR